MFKYETLTSEVDLTKTCFLPVASVASSFSKTKEIQLILDKGFTIIKVNTKIYDQKVSKCAGAKTVNQIYDEIYEQEHEKWLEEGRRYLIGLGLNQVSPRLPRWVDVLPDKFFTTTIVSSARMDLRGYNEYKDSYDKVKKELKFNTNGLVSKIKRKFEAYPLLLPAIDSLNIDNKEEVINQYIKQVDSYEQ